jgi:hypothetical protein
MKNMPDPGITTEKILEENNYCSEAGQFIV